MFRNALSCVPLVSDISSNFLSRPVDFKRHALVFALCPKEFWSGRSCGGDRSQRFAGFGGRQLPYPMFNYQIHSQAGSLFILLRHSPFGWPIWFVTGSKTKAAWR